MTSSFSSVDSGSIVGLGWASTAVGWLLSGTRVVVDVWVGTFSGALVLVTVGVAVYVVVDVGVIVAVAVGVRVWVPSASLSLLEWQFS